MKITFLGNFGVDYSSESHYKRTFEKLGHEVFTFQEGQANYRDIKDQALQSDLFFWVHTHGWPTQGAKKLLRELKEAGIPSAGYHLDLWTGLQRQADLETDPYWNIEYFFTADKLFVDTLKERGIKAFYLPAGVVEDECYIGTPRDEFKYDVAFVGSKGYHPEWPYRPQLIEWLEKTYGSRFAHFGGDGKGTIRGKDLNDLYASVKVIVGDTLCLNYEYPYYTSDRLFEAPGRGAFMIFPRIPGIDKFFQLDDIFEGKDKWGFPTDRKVKELATYAFGNFEQLKGLIDYYLAFNSEREEVKMAGHQRVKENHTYTNRLRYLLDEVLAKPGTTVSKG